MALDDFSSDNSSKNSDTSTSTSTSEPLSSDNSPGMAQQTFTDKSDVSPRAIKYQVKTYSLRWVTQFSTRRISEGELVLYGTSPKFSDQSECVVVFTTITSAIDQPKITEKYPIQFCIWDKEKMEQKGQLYEITQDSSWQDKLYKRLGMLLDSMWRE